MIGGISVWQLLILLLIVVLVFGTKRLRNIGGDLGGAIKGFRKGMEEEPEDGVNRRNCLQTRSLESTAEAAETHVQRLQSPAGQPCLMSASPNCSCCRSSACWCSGRSACRQLPAPSAVLCARPGSAGTR